MKIETLDGNTLKATFADVRAAQRFAGIHDRNLRAIEGALGVKVNVRGDELYVAGDPPALPRAGRFLERAALVLAERPELSREDIDYLLDASGGETKVSEHAKSRGGFMTTSRGGTIRPRTEGQARYLEAIGKNTVTIAIGPAGTGKTYLAVAQAVLLLRNDAIDRIVLTRPVVEAGEKLGFLPGDFLEKVDPYFRPLYDALFDMLGPDKVKRYIERGVIEVAPLAYMRGRTLNRAFVILDEAQNTTRGQMKMFLTRIGEDTRAVITGDRTQVDLADKMTSGLRDIADILEGIEGVAVVRLGARDVVRHEIVRRIIEAYERHEAEFEPPAGPDRNGR